MTEYTALLETLNLALTDHEARLTALEQGKKPPKAGTHNATVGDHMPQLVKKLEHAK